MMMKSIIPNGTLRLSSFYPCLTIAIHCERKCLGQHESLMSARGLYPRARERATSSRKRSEAMRQCTFDSNRPREAGARLKHTGSAVQMHNFLSYARNRVYPTVLGEGHGVNQSASLALPRLFPFSSFQHLKMTLETIAEGAPAPCPTPTRSQLAALEVTKSESSCAAASLCCSKQSSLKLSAFGVCIGGRSTPMTWATYALTMEKCAR